MMQLRRLEQRKKAVLELSQRVIAELKSYSNPPPQVHQVMRATFLLLGNSEKETKSWPATQVRVHSDTRGRNCPKIIPVFLYYDNIIGSNWQNW